MMSYLEAKGDLDFRRQTSGLPESPKMFSGALRNINKELPFLKTLGSGRWNYLGHCYLLPLEFSLLWPDSVGRAGP